MVLIKLLEHGQVGRDTQPCPKLRPITSPDRPGLPRFFVGLVCEAVANMLFYKHVTEFGKRNLLTSLQKSSLAAIQVPLG